MKKTDSPYYKTVFDIHKELMLEEHPNKKRIHELVDIALKIYYKED